MSSSKPPPPFYVYARVFHSDQWIAFEAECRRVGLAGCGAAQEPACHYVAKVECSLPPPPQGYEGDLTYLTRAEFDLTGVLRDFDCGPRQVLAANRQTLMNAVRDRFAELYNWNAETDTACTTCSQFTKVNTLGVEARQQIKELREKRAKLKKELGYGSKLLHATFGEGGLNFSQVTTTMGDINKLNKEIQDQFALIPTQHKAQIDKEQRIAREMLTGDIRNFWSNAAAIEYRDPSHFHWLYRANLCRVPGNDDRFLENLKGGAACDGPSYVVQFVTTSSPFPPLIDGKLHAEGRIAFELTRKSIADWQGTPEGGAFFAAYDNYNTFINRIYSLRNSLFLAREDLIGDCDANKDESSIPETNKAFGKTEESKKFENENDRNIQTFLGNQIDGVNTAVDALVQEMRQQEMMIRYARKKHGEYEKQKYESAKSAAAEAARTADAAIEKAKEAEQKMTEAKEKREKPVF